jgi:hypothetical protein
MKITEKTLYEIKLILISYSVLVSVANILHFTHEINTTLYFSIILAFVIITAMLFIKPTAIYESTKNIFFGHLNVAGVNALTILVHALPIYLFKDRQKLKELLKPNIIFYSACMSLLYYLLFRDILQEIYSINECTIVILCSIYYLFFIILSAIIEKYNI